MFHAVFDAIGFMLFIIGYILQNIGWLISSRRGNEDIQEFLFNRLSTDGKKTMQEIERMRDHEDAD